MCSPSHRLDRQGYLGGVGADVLRQSIDQSGLARATFDYVTGELRYQNLAFAKLCEPQTVLHIDELLDRLRVRTQGLGSLTELRDSWDPSQTFIEEFGGLTLADGDIRWVWLQVELAEDSDGAMALISMYLYVYYDGLPPLELDATSAMASARDFLSHDLNSVFMSLGLAIDNLKLNPQDHSRLTQILDTAHQRKEDLIQRVLTPIQDPENLHSMIQTTAPDTALPLIRKHIESDDLPRVFSVLIVDDDSALAEQIGMGLRRRGHVCELAVSSETAVGLLESGFSPQVAVIDLRLGNEDGRKVAELVRAIQPNIKVVFMTGFANWAAIASLETNALILKKPFTFDYLESALRESLEGEPRTASDESMSEGLMKRSQAAEVESVSSEIEVALTAGEYEAVLRGFAKTFFEGKSLQYLYESIAAPILDQLNYQQQAGLTEKYRLHRAQWLVVRTFASLASSGRLPNESRGTVVIGGPNDSSTAGLSRRLLGEILRSGGYRVSEIGFVEDAHDLVAACRERNDLIAVCMGPTSVDSTKQHLEMLRVLRPTLPSQVSVFMGESRTGQSQSSIRSSENSAQALLDEGLISGWANDFVMTAALLVDNSSN